MQIKIGKEAEIVAKNFLLKQGLQLIKNNYHCIWGELDLIMLDKNNTIVFIEVRKRNNKHYGGALASITNNKKIKIIKTAMNFLQRHKQFISYYCRFDVVFFDSNNTPIWLPNAFEMSQ